jgi:hypothetical protein
VWVKVLLFYVVFSFGVDTTLLRLDTLKRDTAIYTVLSSFTLIEYSIFAFVLYSIIENVIFRKIMLYSSLVFSVFAVTLYILGLGADDPSFDSLAASIEAILIVLFCMFYLFDQMNKPQVFFIYQEPNFWFVVAFILYFSGTLFLFTQASNMDEEARESYWNINYFLNITKNILFAVAFSTKKSRSLEYSSENPFDHDILENPYKT